MILVDEQGREVDADDLADQDLREMPCDRCGGDGGFDYPESHDPFRDSIRYGWQVCRACGGNRTTAVEFFPIELEDLEVMDGTVGAG